MFVSWLLSSRIAAWQELERAKWQKKVMSMQAFEV
jgi:hypothetical protein